MMKTPQKDFNLDHVGAKMLRVFDAILYACVRKVVIRCPWVNTSPLPPDLSVVVRTKRVLSVARNSIKRVRVHLGMVEMRYLRCSRSIERS